MGRRLAGAALSLGILACAATAAAESPNDAARGFRFRNGWLLEWGASMETLRRSAGGGVDCEAKREVCRVARAALPPPYERGDFHFVRDRFYKARVVFPSREYRTVVDRLTAALGKPDFTEEGKVGDGRGGSFPNSIATWERDVVILEATMRDAEIELGGLGLTHSGLALDAKGKAAPSWMPGGD